MSPTSSLRYTMQGKPAEFSTLTNEFVFVVLCSMGQLLFALFLGDVVVNQVTFLEIMKINPANTPWVVGSFLLPSGITVIIFGSLADLTSPKLLMVASFGWLTVWNLVGVFAVTPSLSILFFIVRAMQGLSIGAMQSTALSLLGRVYPPGIRKTRVFSTMSAMTPIGFCIGCLQGGALSSHPEWIFASNSILCGVCCALTIWALPSMTASDPTVSLNDFDLLGATFAVLGCGLVIFGLTQGVPSDWSPYTYCLIIAGVLSFGIFYLIERRATRPLVDNRIWTTPGFVPLAVSYFLGYGAYVGGWMFYAVRFFLTIQLQTPLVVALYMIPNVVSGVLGTWVVTKTLHIFPGHWVLAFGMIAFAMGPVFFLPQTPTTIYWALAMPGIALVTLGPDLSFAAASIFITSSVPKSFQGSAGSLLMTIQNIAAAIMTAVSDSIGKEASSSTGYELDLNALRAIWWFSLGASLLGVIICVTLLRIPRSEEKDHVS